MGLTVYLPALALNAVTPLSLLWTIALTTAVCTFYTTLGGVKAVIWTDTLQSVAMVAGALAAMVKTIVVVGGFGNIYEAMERGGRWNALNFNPDPTIRYTVWTFLFGAALQRCRVHCVDQATSMRYISCGSIKRARIAAAIALVPTFFLVIIAVLSGAAMYTYYEGCDPLLSNKITKSDQLLPYLVADIFQDIPGVAGLFVGATFSGTMSTMSSGINAASSIILQDFIITWKPSLSQLTRLTISKFLVFFLGIAVMCIAVIVSFLNASVVSIGLSVTGALGGPIFAVFTLGLLFPWANAKGAAFGQILSTVFLLWLTIASLLNGKSNPANRPLPVSVEECPVSNNYTQTTMYNTAMLSTDTTPIDFARTSASLMIDDSYKRNTIETTLYALSNNYYPLVALLITIPIGLLVSFLTGANDPSKANPNLFIPMIDNECFPKSVRKFFRFGVRPLEEYEDSLSTKKEEGIFEEKPDLSTGATIVVTKL